MRLADEFEAAPTPRAKWKVLYRHLRISRRVAVAVLNDMMIFGTGCMFVGDDGDVRHVPPWEWVEAPRAKQ